MYSKSLISRTMRVDHEEAKRVILEQLRKSKGNVRGAARMLGVTRDTLRSYLVILGIEDRLEEIRRRTTWRLPELRTFARGGKGDCHGHFKRYTEQKNRRVRAKQTATMAKKRKENEDLATPAPGIEKLLDGQEGER